MMNKWYEKSGLEGDVVISTRIRLARNLRDYPFPNKLSLEMKKKIDNLVKDAILRGNSAIANRFSYVDMSKLNNIESVSLVERHLVSPEFISNPEGRGLLLLDDESISIMINEEDHIRIQVMENGLDLNSAYDIAEKIDRLLDEQLDFAYDESLGYLTQCPTNLGTGMRASIMLHLPALQECGSMTRISKNLSKLGLTIRGAYGEGTEPVGAMYQLSNQVTLGISEKEAINNLKNIAMQLIKQERSARDSMSKYMEILDAIGRSVGILRNAKLLNNNEFMKLISNVRLGIYLGVVDNISYDTVNALIVEAQPATIIKNTGKELSATERDIERAKLVNKRLR